MILGFNDKQIEVMSAMNIPFDPAGDLSDDQICDLTEIVAGYLTTHCFDENDEPNEAGRICEDILEIIGRN